MNASVTPARTGLVIGWDDPAYAGRRAIFNTAIDRHPALVAPCSTTEDVVAAVRYARERELPLSVRAGGHNFAGHALVDDGLVIDLRPMGSAVVDPERRVVTAQPGLVWNQLDAVTARHGLAATGGSISTVGIAGFTLGTGLGWLARRYGLAGDGLLAAEVVTAEGAVVRADADDHPELHWALRGGAGNFGVVTSFELSLHPASTVTAGSLMVGLHDAARALAAVRDATADAADDLNWTAVIVTLPPDPQLPEAVRGQQVLLVNVFDTGPLEEAEVRLAGLRSAVRPTIDTVAPTPYVDFQRSADAGAPEGACWDVRSEWLASLDDAAIEALVASAAEARSPLYELVIRPLGGAIARLPSDATPFSWRSAGFLLEVIAGWFADDDRGPQHRSWMEQTWTNLLPWTAGGPDVSHLGVGEGVDRVRAAYSEATYARLVDVKRRYDPGNEFRSTQNVPPDG